MNRNTRRFVGSLGSAGAARDSSTKLVTVCRTPFSEIVKSRSASPVTGFPVLFSITATSVRCRCRLGLRLQFLGRRRRLAVRDLQPALAHLCHSEQPWASSTVYAEP
jgi:hypothetical protein